MNGLHWKQVFLKLIFVGCTIISLSSCIDLSGSRSTYVKNSARLPKQLSHSAHGLGEIHTMRGGLGIFSIGMNQLRNSVAEHYKIPAYSTMWYNAGHVTRFIINRYYVQGDHSPIILVGHSLGANEQIKVARNLNAVGIPVDLLVTIDAVSQTIVPTNVHYALNIYKPGYVPMFSGLKLRAVDPTKTIIENINVTHLKGITVNHFTIDKDPLVQALILERVKKVLGNGKQQGA
ncbi:MAG: hypothetical protein PSV35_07870 [bacterium]|nr:hypothetical protein [bacterium]